MVDRELGPSGPLGLAFARRAILVSAVALALLLAAWPALTSAGSATKTGFGFNGSAGAVRLTGGGDYDPATSFVKAAGGFRCEDAVTRGPLAGCQAGEGVRWEAVELLPSTNFKCLGPDQLKTATTSDRTVVLLADFYRAGDGQDESFTAQMIVSVDDIAPDIAGVQNGWVQVVGCGPAQANFSR